MLTLENTAVNTVLSCFTLHISYYCVLFSLYLVHLTKLIHNNKINIHTLCLKKCAVEFLQ